MYLFLITNAFKVVTLDYFKKRNIINLKNELIKNTGLISYYVLNYIFDEFNYEVFIINETSLMMS